MSALPRIFAKFKQAVIQLPFRLLPSQGDASWAVSLGGTPPDAKPAPGKAGQPFEGIVDGAIVEFDSVTGKWVEVKTGLPPVEKKKAKSFQKQVDEDDLTQLLAEIVETDEDDDGNDDFMDFADGDEQPAEEEEDAGLDDFLNDL